MTDERIKELEISGKIDFLRQKGFYDPVENPTKINIIGCGGIGSMTALLAAKLGIADLVLFDHDTVEAHNIPNQFFSLDSVGMSKVEAAKQNIEEFTASQVEIFQGKFKSDTVVDGLAVSGVDSMKSRERIWEGIKENPLVPRYWDARIGGQVMSIYSVDPNNPEECAAFETTLYSDSEAVDLPCTERAVIDVMSFVASLIVNDVRKFLAGQEESKCVFFNASELNITTCDIMDLAPVEAAA